LAHPGQARSHPAQLDNHQITQELQETVENFKHNLKHKNKNRQTQ